MDEALALACRLLEGLAVAHDGLLVHRDIKPANIMLTEEGEVKLLDLGLAKLATWSEEERGDDEVPRICEEQELSPVQTVTVEGGLAGTPGYMSPEQVAGQRADLRSDIWAFGLVLFEMLCGRRAIASAMGLQALRAVQEYRFDPGLLPPGLPVRLVAALGRCLNQNRRHRYHHARDLLHDLEEAGEVMSSQRYGAGCRRSCI